MTVEIFINYECLRTINNNNIVNLSYTFKKGDLQNFTASPRQSQYK